MKLWCRLCNSGFHVPITALPVPPFCPACRPIADPPKKPRRTKRGPDSTNKEASHGSGSPS